METYRKIPLTHGQVALVDVDDYDRLSQWKWCALWNPRTKSFYAYRNSRMASGITRAIYMHREVMGVKHRSRTTVDHRYHDTLDNRKECLRKASYSENNSNRRRRSTNTTGHTGVSKRNGKWRVVRQFGGKCIDKQFDNYDEAVVASKTYALQLHGEFAMVV